jgi:tRNA threonylcarbamoyladenosine biosynthesis protein TsaB
MDEPWFVIETSGRGGAVGLAVGGDLRTTPLDPARRHNRDLAPAVAGLLADAGLKPSDVAGVMVGIGPGSYTGLRVGLMSAKAFAWATGCRLVPVPTFRAVAERVPEPVAVVDVIADALQGMAYVQRFRRAADGWEPVDELRIEPAAGWADRLAADVSVSGPGLVAFDGLIRPDVPRVPVELRLPTADAVRRAGRRLPPVVGAAFAGLEPLYLRGSSAEEKAKLTAGSGPGSG